MPLTNLTATAQGFRTAWILGAGPTKVVAINTDDWPLTYIEALPPPTDLQTFVWTDLPIEATGGEIIQYQTEITGRRSGGIAGADWRVLFRDPTTTAEIQGPTHLATANAPADRHFDVHPLDPNGIVWTPAQVNAVEVGLAYNGGGTGIAAYFEIAHITWGGSGGSIYVEGACWLGPLLASLGGLVGANLFHESDEALRRLDLLIGRVLRRRGVMTRPTLSLRDEAESMKWAIFRRPALCIP